MDIKIVGLIAAFCTTLAYVPQAIRIIHAKKLKEISLFAYVLLTIGVLMWTVYGFILKDNAIIFANGISFLLAGSILILKIKRG